MPYTDAIALAAANPDMAFRFMWQLVEDERRLHNQTAILGRAMRPSGLAQRSLTSMRDALHGGTGMAE
jgi:hypothetical protein